ncbi:MAG: hypothetical protein P1U41_08800, partial [Vicingaceae bacterium]|nr:hypothetical protein [Vicingaceae bacterium]
RFRQHGGKKLQPGMLIERSTMDWGLFVSVGFALSPELNKGDVAASGLVLSMDYNLSKRADNFFPPGFYAGFTYRKTNFETIIDERRLTGANSSFFIKFTKETYLTAQGNFFLLPSLGIGNSRVKVDREFINTHNYSIALGIGLHMGWFMHDNTVTSIIAKPTYGPSTDYSNSLGFEFALQFRL